MSRVVIDRAVVEQALEALQWHYRQGHSNTLGGFRLKIDEKALRELRAALAQQDEPRNQCGETCERAKLCATCAQALAQQAETAQEPAYKVKVTSRWHDTEPLAAAFNLPDGEHLLYTAPPPPQRKPLTKERLLYIYNQLPNWGMDMDSLPQGLEKFARAVERAHGVKE